MSSLRTDANNIFLSHASQNQFSPSLYQEFGARSPSSKIEKKKPASDETTGSPAESPASSDDALGTFINAGMTPNRMKLPAFQDSEDTSAPPANDEDDAPSLRETRLEASRIHTRP